MAKLAGLWVDRAENINGHYGISRQSGRGKAHRIPEHLCAAKKSGRSLTSEVGYRVERGFDYEKLFGSEYTQILIRLIADAITGALH
jgi:hypothetical protein